MSGTFLRHESCPSCGSSDNLSVYSNPDGRISKYCESPNCDYSENLKGGTDTDLNPDAYSLPDLEYGDLTKRKISEHYAKKYGVGVHDGKLYAPYYRDGKLVGAKVRTQNKEFRWEGNSRKVNLFGQPLFKSGSKSSKLVITEGELDAVAACQMLDAKYAVVSIPLGAKSAVKSIKDNLQWVESFESVYVCFDSDEAGVQAADEVLELLKLGIGHRVVLNRKDACEYLQNGESSYFKEAVKNAEPTGMQVIVSMEETAKKLHEYCENTTQVGEQYGIPEVDDLGIGLYKGAVSVTFANPSVGKSTFVRQVAANLINRGKKVLVCPFEESPWKYLNTILSMSIGIQHDSFKSMSAEERGKVYSKHLTNIMLSELSMGMDAKTLYTYLEYSVRSRDIEYIIFDNITMYSASSAKQSDFIGDVFATLTKIATKFNVHVLVVSHTKRDSSIKDGEPPSLFHGYNSGSIERYADLVLALGRDITNNSNEYRLAVRKNREGGNCGECTFTYDVDTGTFKGCNTSAKPKPVVAKTEKEKTSQTKEVGTEEIPPNKSPGYSMYRGFPVADKHFTSIKILEDIKQCRESK